MDYVELLGLMQSVPGHNDFDNMSALYDMV